VQRRVGLEPRQPKIPMGTKRLGPEFYTSRQTDWNVSLRFRKTLGTHTLIKREGFDPESSRGSDKDWDRSFAQFKQFKSSDCDEMVQRSLFRAGFDRPNCLSNQRVKSRNPSTFVRKMFARWNSPFQRVTTPTGESQLPLRGNRYLFVSGNDCYLLGSVHLRSKWTLIKVFTSREWLSLMRLSRRPSAFIGVRLRKSGRCRG